LEKRLAQLEGRVAELHDKLADLTITEEEWETFQKVISVLTGQAGLPAGATDPACFPQALIGYGTHQNCGRCHYFWMAACVTALCWSGGGKKPDADFGDLGKE
jgi:hypothetical protein